LTGLCALERIKIIQKREVIKMPGGDGTGPRGLGAGTGWGFGPCGAGMRRGFRRGIGFGGGYGRRRFGFMPQQTSAQFPTNEKDYLQQELTSIEQEEKMLNQEREDVKKKIEELKKHEQH
jgi:hypothetical protein